MILAPDAIAGPRQLVGLSGNGWVNLTWAPPSSGNPSSYNVYRNSSLIGNITDIVDQDANVNYNDTTVTNGEVYSYQVASVENGSMEGGYSNSILKSPSISNLPSAPRNFGFEASPFNDGILFFWDPSLSDGGSSINDHTLYLDNGSEIVCF